MIDVLTKKYVWNLNSIVFTVMQPNSLTFISEIFLYATK